MRRGHIGWVTLFCLAVGGSGCASRKDGMAPETPSPSTSQAPEANAVATILTCTMSVAPRLKAGEPVEVRFQFRNPTAQPVLLLDWHTPIEGLRNNFLEVTRDGAEVPYAGPMLKRGDPSAEDYVSIAPGATVDASVEASLAYDFTQPGQYRIAFRGALLDVAPPQAQVPRPRDQFQPAEVRCPAVETTIVAP